LPLLGVQPVVDRQPTGLAVFGVLPLSLLFQPVNQPRIDGWPPHASVSHVAICQPVALAFDARTVRRGFDCALFKGADNVAALLAHDSAEDSRIQPYEAPEVDVAVGGLAEDRADKPTGIVGAELHTGRSEELLNIETPGQIERDRHASAFVVGDCEQAELAF
jgi:hypothetical protein